MDLGTEIELFFKAKQAQIGEIRTRGDGRKYKKIGNSGNSKTDWQLITNPKEKKVEETNVKDKPANLEEAAKQTSEQALQNAIKQSDDPEERKIANQELERRKTEEKVTDKESGEAEKEDKIPSKEDSNKKQEKNEETIDSLKQKMKDLRNEDIDYDDDKAYDKNLKEIQKVRQQILDLKDKQSSLRKVSFAEYYKGFKRFEKPKSKDQLIENKELHKIFEYYQKNNIVKGTGKEKESLTNYIRNNLFEDARNVLTKGVPTEDSTFSQSEVRQNIKQLSLLINKNKIKENLVLNRRVNVKDEKTKKFFTTLKQGEIYEDKSFSSTSLIEQPIFGDFNIQILAKKGGKVMNADNEQELEYLIDKGSKFRVLKTNKTGIIVELL